MQVSADLVANFAEATVVKISRVSRVTSDDELWLELNGLLLQKVVVNQCSLLIDTVLLGIEVYR